MTGRNVMIVVVALVLPMLTLTALFSGCSDTTSPEPLCYTYAGFQALVENDSLFLWIDLDFTWEIPDSAVIVTPTDTLQPDTIYHTEFTPGALWIDTKVSSVVSGDYVFTAFYDSTVREFHEYLKARQDFLAYDFTLIKPARGSASVSTEPTFEWTSLPQTEAFISVYSDSLETRVFQTGAMGNQNSLELPAGKLEAGRRYYWTLYIAQTAPAVPCQDTEYEYDFRYEDRQDNVVNFVGWFTTADQSAQTR